jgi:hypothetical protein
MAQPGLRYAQRKVSGAHQAREDVSQERAGLWRGGLWCLEALCSALLRGSRAMRSQVPCPAIQTGGHGTRPPFDHRGAWTTGLERAWGCGDENACGPRGPLGPQPHDHLWEKSPSGPRRPSVGSAPSRAGQPYTSGLLPRHLCGSTSRGAEVVAALPTVPLMRSLLMPSRHTLPPDRLSSMPSLWARVRFPRLPRSAHGEQSRAGIGHDL